MYDIAVNVERTIKEKNNICNKQGGNKRMRTNEEGITLKPLQEALESYPKSNYSYNWHSLVIGLE